MLNNIFKEIPTCPSHYDRQVDLLQVSRIVWSGTMGVIPWETRGGGGGDRGVIIPPFPWFTPLQSNFFAC